MAIQATFTADTRPLEAGMERAASKIAQTKRASEDTGRALKAMGSSFDGTKTEGTALRIAASVQKIGGAVRLTDAEWKRADRTVADVLQKYERMGTVAPAAIQALRRELDQVKSSATQASSALGGIASGASKGLGAIAGGLGIGIGAGLGLGALTALGATVKELAGNATKLTPLSQAFERLQGGAVAAERSLLGLRVATKGLVSDTDLLQAANKGNLLGLDAMGIQFDEVARIATVLGRAMGQDAAKSVDDLTTALSRMSPQILDNLGIKVDLTKATEDYARSIKKSADELTEEEKKRAFATAAMEAARAKAQELGEIQLTVADQSARIAIAFSDIATQAFSAGNQSSTFAGKLGEVADALAKIRAAGVGTSFRVLASEAAGAVQNAVKPFLNPFNLGGALLYGGAGAVRSAAGVTPEDISSVIFGQPQRTGRIGASGPRTTITPPPAVSGGGTSDTAVRVKKISDAQRDLNRQVEAAFKVSRQAAQGWDEYAGAVQLVEMELAAFLDTQRLANQGTIDGATNPLSAVLNGPYLYQIRDNMTAGVLNGTKRAAVAAQDWRESMRGVAQAFGTLAQIAGPSLDGAARGMGTVIAAGDAAFQTVGALADQFEALGNGKGGLSTGGRALAGGMAGLSTGLALGSLFTNRGGGFVAGAAGGAVSGAIAGGAVGAGVGAVVGGFSGLFAANQNRKAQAQAVEQMRQQTIAAFGTVDDFRAAVERAGYSYDYFLQSFNSNKPATFARIVNDLNTALAEQKKRADALVAGLSEVARVQGVLSQQQLAQMRLLRPGDPGVEEVLAFAQGQRQQAETGLIRAVTALETYGANALDDFGTAAQGAAAGLFIAFTEALEQGESALDVLSRLGGAIDVLSRLGVGGAGFNSLRAQQGIVSGAQTGPAAQLGAGLGQALAGFANTGLLSPELFGELANGIGEAYKAIENLGQGGLEAARLFQPYLQSIDKILRDNPALEGQLDDQTRALIDFARQAGIIGPKFDSAADRILSALDKLIGKLDEFIGRMSTAAGIVIPTPGTPPPPAGGSDGGVNPATGGDYGSTASGYSTMGVATAAPMGGGVSQVITVQLGRETIARAVAEDLPRLVQVYGGAA